MYISLCSAHFFTFFLPLFFPSSSFTFRKHPHLNARSKSVPLTAVPSGLFECQDWKHASMTLRSVLDQSGLKQMCKYPWAGTRGPANGSQPSIPVEQDVLLHPPIYWNLSSNILESIFRYWCKILYINIFQCAHMYSKARRRSHFTFIFASAPSSD